MNLTTIGYFGNHTTRTTTRPMPRTSQPALQFGSAADKVRRILKKTASEVKPKPGPEEEGELFKKLCDPIIWSGKDNKSKDCSLRVVHFLQESIEKGALSINEFMKGLNLTQEGIQALETSLDSLKTEGFVGQLLGKTYAITSEGLKVLKQVYPDLELPIFGYIHYLSFSTGTMRTEL